MTTQTSQNAYYKDWYARNKEKLSVERRKKYHTDPEYRQSILEKGKEWREKTGYSRVGSGQVGPRPVRSIEVNGEAVTVYTIGYLSKLIGVKPQTIRAWIKRQILPETKHKDRGKNRLWTGSEIEAIVSAVRTAIEKQGRIVCEGSIFPILVRKELERVNGAGTGIQAP